jgi:hypothetical protein
VTPKLRNVVKWGCGLAVATVAILTIVVIVWGGPEPDRANRAQVWGTVWAITGSVGTVCARWMRRHHRDAGPAPTMEQVASATESLAFETATYWCEQARQQGITATSPVAVRWRVGPADLAGPVVDLRTAWAPASREVPETSRLWLPSGQPRLTRARQLPPPSASRPLSRGIVTAWYEDLYVNLHAGEVLVVLGEPGSGKSGALLLLLLQALDQRDRLSPEERAKARVPVWVTCGSWDPTTTTLTAHVVEVLIRTYPGLTAPAHGGPAGPAALLQHGRVAVFLDGLDEMQPHLRPLALEAIQTQAGRIPVILTSRTDEFRTAMSTGTFHPAGMIELLPVTPDAAASFLQSQRQPDRRKAAWQPVIDHVRTQPDGPLGQVLATPLGLCLARDVATDPAGLIPTASTTPRAVLAGLIGTYLDHAYPWHEQRHRDQAVYWLSWTAHHLGTARDLHWWDPPRWIPRWQARLARGLAVGLGGGLAVGLGFGLTTRPACALAYGLGIGLAVGLAVGLGVEPDGDPRHGARLRTAGRSLRAVLTGCLMGAAAVGLAFALMFGLAAGLTDGVTLGGGIGFVVGIAAGAGTGPDGEPRRIVPRVLPSRQLRDVLARALASGLVGVALGLAFLGADGLVRRPAFGLVGALTVGLAGLAVGLVRGLAQAWGNPLKDSGVSFPALSYRIHRSTSALFGVLFGGIVGVVAGVVFGREYGLATGLTLGVACGMPVGLAAGLTTGIVPAVAFTELTLLVSRRGRVRFLRLFEDALGRQVLRQAGSAYQFRHAALQDYLAARYEAAGKAGRHDVPLARGTVGSATTEADPRRR